MKTNLTSRSLFTAFLLVMIAFSQPLTTLAQQNSAEVQAKQDAEADMNKWLWTGVGFVTPFCITLGCIAGFYVGSMGAQSYDFQSGDFQLFSDQQLCGTCVGFAVGYTVPFIPMFTYLGPPPERLLGKSPEYVNFYTDAYKSKNIQLRGKWLTVGSLLGGIGVLYIIVSIVDD